MAQTATAPRPASKTQDWAEQFDACDAVHRGVDHMNMHVHMHMRLCKAVCPLAQPFLHRFLPYRPQCPTVYVGVPGNLLALTLKTIWV